MRLLQKVLQQASSPDATCRKFRPDSAPEWAEAWTNLEECCDMAMGRAFHYREYGLEEVLARFCTVLTRAIFGTWDQDDPCVATLPCRLTPLDHDAWYRYEQHVGGFHTCHFDAALLDGNELLTNLQNEAAFEREAQWLHMALDQIEGTRESMRHRIAAPAPLVLDFWVEAAMWIS